MQFLSLTSFCMGLNIFGMAKKSFIKLCVLENSFNILWKQIQSVDSVNETPVTMCHIYQKLLVPGFLCMIFFLM